MRVSGVWARAGCAAIMSNDKVETQTSHDWSSRQGGHNAQAVGGNSVIVIVATATLNCLFYFRLGLVKTKQNSSNLLSRKMK